MSAAVAQSGRSPAAATAPVLISHALCPYVQRCLITAAEKGIIVARRDVDLAAKPEWFVRLSPLGKVPLLLLPGGAGVLFESDAICQYLDETWPGTPLLGLTPLVRARQRAGMAFASAVLDDIAGFYSAKDRAALDARRERIRTRLAWLDGALGAGPWFEGSRFTLVDAAFAPVFRYFGVLESLTDFAVLDGAPRVARWRKALAARASVRAAVAPDYPQRLRAFIAARDSALGAIARGGV